VPSVETDPEQVTRALQRGREAYFLAYNAQWAGYLKEKLDLLEKFDSQVVFKVGRAEGMCKLTLRDYLPAGAQGVGAEQRGAGSNRAMSVPRT
jgi:hypothetical protein